MKVGITGTRNGATYNQKKYILQALNFLQKEYGANELHHGDCVGVDEQVADMALILDYKVVCHPPLDSELRAFHPSHEILKPLGYLERDRKIVDAVDILLVAPKENSWRNSGGTWYTHDYAIKRKVRTWVFFPDQHGPRSNIPRG